MNNSVSVELEELLPVMQEKLSLGGSFTFSPKGISMLPFIRPGLDSVTISGIKDKIRKYDILLYRRDNGQFVLHRVIDLKKNSYVMCGDNQLLPEHNVCDRHVIGIVSKINKPDCVVDVNDEKYIHCVEKHVNKQRKKGIYVRFKRTVKRFLIKIHILKGAKD